jgi:hypothetical protein
MLMMHYWWRMLMMHYWCEKDADDALLVDADDALLVRKVGMCVCV